MFENLRGLIIGILCYYSIKLIMMFTFLSFQTELFPSIYLYWQRYQAQMLAKLKAIQDGIIIAGDGRHDSTGHSAKFGAYTIFCCTVPMIIHFSLVQVRYIFYHYYFWVMHLQCSSLQCHLEILYTLYRVHNLCTLLFYSQMHFFNLLIDLTNNLIFIGDIKLVFPFYLYLSFFYRGIKLEIVQGWNLWHFNIAWTSCWLMAF